MVSRSVAPHLRSEIIYFVGLLPLWWWLFGETVFSWRFAGTVHHEVYTKSVIHPPRRLQLIHLGASYWSTSSGKMTLSR